MFAAPLPTKWSFDYSCFWKNVHWLVSSYEILFSETLWILIDCKASWKCYDIGTATLRLISLGILAEPIGDIGKGAVKREA